MRLIAVATTLFVSLLLGCDDEEGSAPPRARSAEKAVSVRVERVSVGDLRDALNLVGELTAPESVEVASEIAGRLRNVTVEMGARVEEGDLLVVIDDSELRAQLAEAKAAVDVSRAAVTRAQAETRRAETELARKAPLAAEDLVTRQVMDEVQSRRETAQASLLVAQAQQAQAAAKTAVLRQKLSSARVSAPFNGWVEARHLDQGAVVSPGSKILRLVRTDPAVARFMVSERHVGRIRSGMEREEGVEVTLQVPAFPGQSWQGRLARVSPALDPDSRAATAEAEFSNGDGRLMPGMYSRLQIQLSGSREAILVPVKALSGQVEAADQGQGAAEARVFVVTEEGVARARTVEVGETRGSHAEVLRGLRAGDLVVVEGQSGLRDGARARVVDRSATSGDREGETAPPDRDAGRNEGR